jgi:hypothetical protein
VTAREARNGDSTMKSSLHFMTPPPGIRDTVRARVERKISARLEDPLTVVDDTFMSNQQIAEMFAISSQTVLNAQNDGELPYCVFGDRKSTRPTRRTPKRAVLEWAASRLIRRP